MADGDRETVTSGRTVGEATAVGASRLGLRADEVDVEVLQEAGRGWLGLGSREARVRVRRPSKGAAAERLLVKLAEHLGSVVDIEIDSPEGEPPCWSLRISTADAARWIGYRGQMLEAIRVWCDAAATRVSGCRDRMLLDVGGYRDRRETALRVMAERAAARVRQSGKEIALEPMTSGDRRIIHGALQGAPGVRTESIGLEPHRRVVVRPAP